jgi:predicted SprT family Zn-dependent metalloprotease
MSTPTEQAYTELQSAYDFFNARLFDGQLPPCLMTFQRKNRTYGYFSGERWNSLTGTLTDEIAMNPVHFATRSAEDVLSTLVHEMAHLWQHHFGTPSRSAYHNREWAAQMDALGLCPSDTGQPGGKRTGQSMSHYVVAGGPFAQACAALLAEGFAISWRDRARAHAPGKTPGKAGGRTKYTCPGCGLNAWAKPEVVLLCGACEVALEPEEAREP